ncbi:MAG TPA: S9 family peptidase [Brevundimonas sp.]|jgi:acylaminoacyl-peptidase|uniref:S9 family peptidase n=1 Tax=Brevundimonas sp. TaxID=1871086 RepID=UPI002E128E40|nr:S9 family peptidase [Brevundimonas sp.]
MRVALLAALLLGVAGPALGQDGPPAAPAAAPTASGGLSLEQLALMARVSDPQLSPDGRRVLYHVRTTDWAGNRGVGELWLIDGDSPPRRLAASDGGAGNGRWSADGRAIYFLSGRGGSSQVWRTDAEGQAATQVTTSPVDVAGFRVSPSGDALVLVLPVFIDCAELACTRDRLRARATRTATVEAYDRLPLRPWDSWNDGRRNHLFVQALNGSGLADGAPRALTPGLDADVPSRPMGGEGEYVISPDGRHVVFSTRTQGRTEAFTNNSDLHRVAVDGGAPVNLTPGNSAPDFAPAISPDGRRLAWLAGRRENVGGDQAAIMVAEADGSGARVLVGDWDRGPASLAWRSDGRALYATAADNGQQKLFQIDARTGRVEALTDRGAVSAFDETGGRLVMAWDASDRPTQILEDGRPLTDHNAALLAGTALSTPEPFTFAGWNGNTVQGWVYKPVGFVEGRTYPVAHLIHGGPKSPWTDGWGYRWNPQTYAAAGFGVVMINFHGSPGFGQAFTDAINDHWGDRPLEDLQKGFEAALAANPWMDRDRACALGASYGGYMVNMIAGRAHEPYRCLVNHAGVFDVGMLMNAMDIGNFIWEFGGPSWERAGLYAEMSPNTYVAAWETPMLVLHGSRDFRVPVEQGLATFSALQRQGVPSRFVHVPDENHWILKPQNWVAWQREILDWTAAHTAPR